MLEGLMTKIILILLLSLACAFCVPFQQQKTFSLISKNNCYNNNKNDLNNLNILNNAKSSSNLDEYSQENNEKNENEKNENSFQLNSINHHHNSKTKLNFFSNFFLKTSSSLSETSSKKQSKFSKIKKEVLLNGISGALGGVLQVVTLMWLRTLTSYQYKYGGNMYNSFFELYQQGGIARFYKGWEYAILQGPLSRFGSVASNELAKNLFQYYHNHFENKKKFEDFKKNEKNNFEKNNYSHKDKEMAMQDKFFEKNNFEKNDFEKNKLNSENKFLITFVGGIFVTFFRFILMPIDTCKTISQVDGTSGINKLFFRVFKNGEINLLFQGTSATLLAAFISHYPWFLSHNFLIHYFDQFTIIDNIDKLDKKNSEKNSVSEKNNKNFNDNNFDEKLIERNKKNIEILKNNFILRLLVENKIIRNALIGFISTAISDIFSNSFRVIKTIKQTNNVDLNYIQVIHLIYSQGGIMAFLGRGLISRIISNGLQGVIFTVVWKGLVQYLNEKEKKIVPKEKICLV